MKPSLFSFNPKQLSLAILIIQSSMQVIMMRYSLLTQKKDMYIASTAVFMAEIFKIAVCLFMLHRQKGSHWTTTLRVLRKPQELVIMLIPSGLYALQNNLLYIALSNLEAATFQVTYQLKILTTAIFSVWLLGRSLNRIKWLSLCLLMVGVIFVQMESTSNNNSKVENDQKPFIGLAAVLASCISSGFAGCYFEKLLKASTASMWVRNIQLGLCGLFFSFWAMIVSDYSTIQSQGLFHGYNLLTWCVITNQALGGLLVSLVVKYADNILKGFATSISIILSGMISFCFFDFKPSILFILGSTVVMTATVLYSSNFRL